MSDKIDTIYLDQIFPCEAHAPSQAITANCNSGKKVFITMAHYGRVLIYSDTKICGSKGFKKGGPRCGNNQVSHRDLTNVGKAECNGKSSCSFYGTNHYAGDPCPGVAKYTVIQFMCETGNFTFENISHYKL